MRIFFVFIIISFLPVCSSAQDKHTETQDEIFSELSGDLTTLYDKISQTYKILKENDKAVYDTYLSRHTYFETSANAQIMSEPSKDSKVLLNTTRPEKYRIISHIDGWYEVLFFKADEIPVDSMMENDFMERLNFGWIESSNGHELEKQEIQQSLPNYRAAGEGNQENVLFVDKWIDKNIEVIIKKLKEKIFEPLINKANEIKKKYENNSFIYVSGFTIDFGIPPSISISFSFKEKNLKQEKP